MGEDTKMPRIRREGGRFFLANVGASRAGLALERREVALDAEGAARGAPESPDHGPRTPAPTRSGRVPRPLANINPRRHRRTHLKPWGPSLPHPQAQVSSTNPRTPSLDVHRQKETRPPRLPLAHAPTLPRPTGTGSLAGLSGIGDPTTPGSDSRAAPYPPYATTSEPAPLRSCPPTLPPSAGRLRVTPSACPTPRTRDSPCHLSLGRSPHTALRLTDKTLLEVKKIRSTI